MRNVYRLTGRVIKVVDDYCIVASFNGSKYRIYFKPWHCNIMEALVGTNIRKVFSCVTASGGKRELQAIYGNELAEISKKRVKSRRAKAYREASVNEEQCKAAMPKKLGGNFNRGLPAVRSRKKKVKRQLDL